MHILSCLQGTEWIPSGVARGGKVQLPRLLTQEEQNHPHTHTNPTLTCWETEMVLISHTGNNTALD